jgi:regulator of sigma E protease
MLTDLVANIWGMLAVAVPFLFVLTIVVFFHELGHFLVARWCGVEVSTFSIGFGKEIFGFNDKHGTRWRFAWIPLGGYVKFMDDDNPASAPTKEALENMSAEQRAGSFHGKPLWQRAAVVAAGPIANFLLAIAIFAVWFSIFGVRTLDPKIEEVIAESPAAAAGFQAGDLIVRINGEEIQSFEQVKQAVVTSGGRQLAVDVERKSEIVALQVTPQLKQQEGLGGDKVTTYIVGLKPVLTPGSSKVYQPGIIEAVGLGGHETWKIVTLTLGYLGDVVIGRQPADQLGGPARIADLAGKVAERSFLDVIFLTAFISVSVGLINLFPIPILDGGHLLFYAIEAIRRRPLSPEVQEMGFRIGLAVVLCLMIFATFNDLPIIKRWFGAVG